VPFCYNIDTRAILHLVVLMPLRGKSAGMSTATHGDSLDWLLVGAERASYFLRREVALASIIT
jgi:preprotein translocase subunit SecG